jgi:NADPH2:quinone reductase
MRALLCFTFSEVDELRIEQFDVPDPGDKQIAIAVEAAGVNFPDGLIVQGKYQVRPPLPFVPGSELAGIVRKVGPGVTDFTEGERVVAFTGIGAFAEQVVAPAEQVYRLPPGIAMTAAAGLLVTYGTAYHALRDRAMLSAGERVLVLGAAGGFGLAAVAVARAMGGHVVAVASSADKRTLARRHGAEEAIGYEEVAGLKARTGAVDVIVDPIGGEATLAALKQLAWGGRHLVIGFAGGDIPQLPANRLLLNAAASLGVLWGADLRRRPDHHRRLIGDLLGWLADGRIRPEIDRIVPLAEARAAIAHVLARKANGKVILTMTDQSAEPRP